jgi:hypothetical protein
VATGGTTGQLLAKASGTNYDTTWTTVIPGDRYLTSSTTSLTINNADKTLTIGTGLSYSPQQDVTISESTSPTTRHMHARVTSYDSGTGVMVVNVISHSGTGTYTSWVVNVGGVTPAASVAWGAITGTLSAQTDLQSALDAKAPLASPTFTGDPKAPTPATADNDTSIATTAFVKNQSYVTSSTLSSALAVYALQNGSSAFSVTGASIKSFDGSDNFAALDQGVLNFGNGSTPSGIVINGSSITFADATVQTTAATGGIPDAPSDGNTYGRNNGSWVIAGGGSGSGTLVMSSGQLYDTSTANFVPDLTLSGTMSAGTVTGGSNATLNSSGLTLAASSGAVITFADATTQSTAPHDLPSGGTTGQVLTKNSATNYDASWATPSGGGGGVNIQTFGSSTTSGTFTWTKPAGAKWVELYLVGGGGGSGSGARQATTVRRAGGGGGGGGAIFYGRIGADFLASTQTVVVGAGGTGGLAVAVNSTNGNNGTAGADTTFGPYKAIGGNLGGGGSSTAGGTAGATRTSAVFFNTLAFGNGNTGGVGGSNPGNPSVAYMLIPLGGAGGAGAEANQTFSIPGSAGGGFNISSSISGIRTSVAGGTGGTDAGVPATAGTSATTQYIQAGTGGGSGFYRTGQATGAGGAGGWPGAGAGGGAGADNGFASGAGGAGANGFALIITYC